MKAEQQSSGAGTLRELSRGNSADRTGEESTQRFREQKTAKAEAKQKPRAGNNTGKNMEEQWQQKINSSGARRGETQNTERMNLCAALP